jgi:hypothetical protein
MDQAQLFALGIALAALSGVRVYLTVLGVGLAGWLGWLGLPEGLQVASSPWVLGTAAALALVEFAADKIPGVDSGWDLLHTVLRIPVGAFLAGAALGADGELSQSGLWLGGAAALATHALKSGTRVLINTSPEPMSNWTASLGEDATAAAGLALVFTHPWLALAIVFSMLAIAAMATAWILRRLLRLGRSLAVR